MSDRTLITGKEIIGGDGPKKGAGLGAWTVVLDRRGQPAEATQPPLTDTIDPADDSAAERLGKELTGTR